MYEHILEVNAKEWFDKSAGNSYFSANITMDDKTVAILSFQYGYDDHYLDMANEKLDIIGLIDNPRKGVNEMREPLWRYCQNNNIKLISHKQENCLKPELLELFGD